MEPTRSSRTKSVKGETPRVAPPVYQRRTRRTVHNQTLKERFGEPDPLSEDADEVTKMKHRLKTRDGRTLYAKRKCTVEPVFGIIKAIMGFRHFQLRGVKFVSGEWDLVCMAWNLKRLHTLAA